MRKDTDNLADFLEQHIPDQMYRIGIKFHTYYMMSEGDMQYYSKVAVCVKNENPTMFKSYPGDTRITPSLIDFIRGLHKNYDLNNLR